MRKEYKLNQKITNAIQTIQIMAMTLECEGTIEHGTKMNFERKCQEVRKLVDELKNMAVNADQRFSVTEGVL